MEWNVAKSKDDTERYHLNRILADIRTTIDSIVSGGAATWGSITGTLSSQTDLQSALNAKENAGVAATLDAAHVAAGDPHPQYALDTDLAGYQPLDSDLTAIAGLAPANDDIIQRKAGAWTNRTMAQLSVDLNLSSYATDSEVTTAIYNNSPWTTAGGTADAITATYTPAQAGYTDGKLLRVRAASANATTTPTLSVDGLAASTIVKHGSQPLVAGDIAGAGHELLLVTRDYFGYVEFELINPAVSGSSGDVVGPASAVNNNVVFFDGTTGKLIKDSGLALSGSNTGDQDLSTYALTTYVDGKVIDSIADSDTTHAPSRNAVFDALALKQDTIPWTTIAGTADALTANFSPDFSVVDGKMFRARALLANATTTPTLAIDGAAPFTIVKKGSAALAAGDISGPDHELLFVVHDYFTHYEYELINPATDATGGGGGTGDAIGYDYTQSSHGFSVGMPVYQGAAGWAQTDRDSDLTPCDAIVSAVADANNFTVVYRGRVTLATGEWDARTGDTGGLVTGDRYWTHTVTGGLTKTQPTSGFAQCIGFAESATTMVFQPGPVFALADASTNMPVGSQIGRAYTSSSTTASTTSTTLPFDNTIPQNTEGVAYASLDTTYTPVSATSKLRVRVSLPWVSALAAATYVAFALFRDSTANAVFATLQVVSDGNGGECVMFEVEVPATATVATTFKLRWGVSSSTGYILRNNPSGQLFGGTNIAFMEVTEIKQ